MDIFRPSSEHFTKTIQFESLLIFVIIIGILKIFYNGNYINIISLLIFSFYLTKVYYNDRVSLVENTNGMIKRKLKNIQNKIDSYITKKIKIKKVTNTKDITSIHDKNQMTSLYIDANMIVFLESIIEMYEYNPDTYYKLIKGTNNILKIRLDIETYLQTNNEYIYGIQNQVDIANNLKVNCIGDIHNFIYSIPKMPKMRKYVNNIITRYQELISYNTNLIEKYSNDNIRVNGINNETKFVYQMSAKPQNTHSYFNLDF
jgi:hypothetical protein